MPARATIRWYGKRVSREVKDAVFAALVSAADYSKTEIVKRISISGNTGVGRVSPAPGAGPPRRYVHSKPGEPPRAITGKLRQTIFSSHSRTQMKAVVGTSSKVGVYLETGTNPTTIRPRRRKVLVFGYDHPGGWGWKFFRRVRHPGIKKRPFIASTVSIERPAIDRHMQRIIKQRLGRDIGGRLFTA